MKGQIDRNWRVPSSILIPMLLTLALGSPLVGNAQIQTTAGINGSVTDTTGAAVPQAEVVVREQLTGAEFRDLTDSGGTYSFPSLLPGLYTITVRKAGFRTEVITDRTVLATQPALVDVQLQVGTTSQSVTVSAVGAELLSTTSQDITATVTPTLVRELPTARGNVFDLLITAPGVVPQSTSTYTSLSYGTSEAQYNFVTAASTVNWSGAFIGGNRDSATNVSVDGSNWADPLYGGASLMPSTEIIQELRVESANMSAEFGYGVSGIDVISKSG